MFDVIIIGNGPAGISASLYTKRANFSTLVIGKDGGSLVRAEKVANYYGFAQPVSGKQLLEQGLAQAKNTGVELLEAEVTGLGFQESLIVKTVSGEYPTKALLIATGISRKTPKIEGLADFDGKGVSYCAVCDGFFYKGLPVAVFGSGAYAAAEATELLSIASSVTILTNGAELTADFPAGVLFEKRKISRLVGENKLHRVEFTEGTAIELSGLFVAVGVAGTADLARKLGILTEGNHIVINGQMQTNLPGIFAAGDCTGQPYQVSKSVGDGARAGLAIIDYLRSQGK